MKTIKNSICTVLLVSLLAMSLCTASFAAESSAVLKVNDPVFSYITEAGIRTAKILEISGELSHGMEERVAGALYNSDGTIADACETDSCEGNFTLKFVLDSEYKKTTYKLVVNSLNSKEQYEKNITVTGLGEKAAISSFSVSGNSGIINSGNINVEADNVYNIEEVIPVFSVTENASVYINGVLQKSGTSKVDFSKGAVTYKVVSEDLKISKTYAVKVNGKSEDTGSGDDFGGSGGGNVGGINTSVPVPEISQSQSQYQPVSGAFSDLASVPWAAEYINKLAQTGVVSGNEYGQFMPDKNVTREEFVKMIVLSLGFSERNGISFSDVSESDWFYPYIDIAYSSGIINGVSENEFGVGQYITREDMAVIAHRAMVAAGKAVAESNGQLKFADDGFISGYATEAVYALLEQGIINGVGSNTFNPKGNTQRSAAAKVICLIMESEGGY